MASAGKYKRIRFKYSDYRSQSLENRKHNYDCEAMVYYNSKLYLFTKNWADCISKNCSTTIYEIDLAENITAPEKKHTAKYIGKIPTPCLVTGAAILKIDTGYELSLIGYQYKTDSISEADIFLRIYNIPQKAPLSETDFKDFTSCVLGKQKELHQVEAICYKDRNHYIISGENDYLKKGFVFEFERTP